MTFVIYEVCGVKSNLVNLINAVWRIVFVTPTFPVRLFIVILVGFRFDKKGILCASTVK